MKNLSLGADFAELHYKLARKVHGVNSRGSFLPWHRLFIAAFEYQLRQINKNITLPFWDTGLDAESASDSTVVADLGGLPSEPGQCIPLGDLAAAKPDGNCIRRNSNPGVLRSLEEIASGQRIAIYTLYDITSQVLHGTVHVESA